MDKKIHFMGVGGSGASACAVIAKSYGYHVEGSNITLDTPYIKQVQNAGISVYEGHDPKLLDKIDLLVISPAIKFKKSNKFIKTAKEKKIDILTWQEFSGKYLQKGKTVICVSGTHGKSTTTALLGTVFEDAGYDPTVLVGAKVKKWGTNYRVGKSKYFITESDEFYDNFLNYSPDAIILGNVEFDHPDFFKDLKHVQNSFKKHINSLRGERMLCANSDDDGVLNVLKDFASSDIDILKYSIKRSLDSSVDLIAQIVDESEFLVDGELYGLGIEGSYNISNSLGVIGLSRRYGIKSEVLKKSLKNFKGIGRRMDLIVKGKIRLYDDYAHHPTAIKVTLAALRLKHKKGKIIAVVEPHSFSRTKSLLKSYKNVFDSADVVILAPIYKARDRQEFGVSLESIKKISGHNKIILTDSIEKAAQEALGKASDEDTIIVMGAGESFKITRRLKELL
ncbi:UDP-N-acetylmuramate--L-alanine ligase [Patescibacteria group bacterium]